MEQQKYHYHDFTHEEYRKLLQIAKSKYIFRNYKNFKEDEHFILWRHDVDFSVHAARKLAQIEAEEKITATYFLLLHSEFYNLFEKEVTECVQEIISLGHNIALHFDCHFYNCQNEESLMEFLAREKKIIEELFNHEIHAFSFHNPNPEILQFNKGEYAGLINTYAEYFQKEVGYCSDSNGYWRHRRLKDVLETSEDECLQVLTHPAWWQQQIMTPKKRIYRCINGRAKKTFNNYCVTFKNQSDRKNLSDLSACFDALSDYDANFSYFVETLWLEDRADTVFIELWRLHYQQLSILGIEKLLTNSNIDLQQLDINMEEYNSWNNSYFNLLSGSANYDNEYYFLGVKFMIHIILRVNNYCSTRF